MQSALFALNVVARQRGVQDIIALLPGSVRIANTQHLDNCSIYEFEIESTSERMFAAESALIALDNVEAVHFRQAVPA